VDTNPSSVDKKKVGWIVGGASAVAALVAFAANLTTVAGWFGYGPEAGDETPDPASSFSNPLVDHSEVSKDPDGGGNGNGETTSAGPSAYDLYMEACQDDGYTSEECDTSRDLDPSEEWTGTLYTYYDVYMGACQDDGHTYEECDTSWANDPGIEWTGTLYQGPYEVYMADCQNDGHTYDECNTSWFNDPGNVWTGTLY
jgi:hypothetical protein